LLKQPPIQARAAASGYGIQDQRCEIIGQENAISALKLKGGERQQTITTLSSGVHTLRTAIAATREELSEPEAKISPVGRGSSVQPEPLSPKAGCSIRDNFEPQSNVAEESDLSPRLHASQRTATDEGRSIEMRPFPRNAAFPNW
jgi:hypothetical protein